MTTEIELELVRELHRSEPEAPPATRERARSDLMRAMQPAAVGRSRPVWRWSRPPLFRSLGLGAAVAVVIALIIVADLQGGVVRPASAAATILRRAALTAEASGGPPVLRRGEYWYVHSRETQVGVTVEGPRGYAVGIVARGSLDRQIWIGRGVPSSLATHVVGPIQFLSARARQQWVRDGRPAQFGGPSGPLPADAFDLPYRKLLALPSNVDALWLVVKHAAGKGNARWQRHEMFTVVGDLLREDPVPARVRAALYLVAARIPGIKMLGLTRDGIGRPALAVALNDTFNGERAELLFDPHTAKLLGEQQTVVKPPPAFHVKPGTVVYQSTYLSSGVVRRIGQRPPS